MARPKKNRNVYSPPSFSNFKPVGLRNADLQHVSLTLDEYEALRLADYDGLEHNEAAEKMQISRPTFTRLITKTRRKISEFIVEGKGLLLEGGSVHFAHNMIRCLDCGLRYKTPLSKKNYVCPKCDSENFEDLAQSFGHGQCCRKFRNAR